MFDNNNMFCFVFFLYRMSLYPEALHFPLLEIGGKPKDIVWEGWTWGTWVLRRALTQPHWTLLGHRLNPRLPLTLTPSLSDLTIAHVAEWTEISRATLQHLVDRLPRSVELIITAKVGTKCGMGCLSIHNILAILCLILYIHVMKKSKGEIISKKET